MTSTLTFTQAQAAAISWWAHNPGSDFEPIYLVTGGLTRPTPRHIAFSEDVTVYRHVTL